MGLFQFKKSDSDIYHQICKLNSKNRDMALCQFTDSMALLIDKITNATEDEANEIFDILLADEENKKRDKKSIATPAIAHYTSKDFRKVKECVWLAFFENGNLSEDRILEILKNTNDRISMHYLCREHRKMTPAIDYAIGKIDHLSLHIVGACVDMSKMPYFVLSELFPFYSHEILVDSKHDYFFEKIYNDSGIMFLINNGILSQDRLALVCNNENLQDETRNMAFAMLDDIYSVSRPTKHMKQCLFDASVSALFEYEDTPHSYIREADNYLFNATLNPEVMLTEDMESRLVELVLIKNAHHFHPYLKNLLTHGKNKRIFRKIANCTTNLCLDAEASAKHGEVEDRIFSNLAFVIRSLVVCDKFPDADQISAFRAIMKNRGLVTNLPKSEFTSLLATCIEHKCYASDVLVSIATAPGIPNDILEFLCNNGNADSASLAKFHLDLRKAFHKDDEEIDYIMNVMECIYHDEFTRHFGLVVSTDVKDGKKLETVSHMFSCPYEFKLPTLFEYTAVKEAFESLMRYPLFTYNQKAKLAAEALRDYLLIPFEVDNRYLKKREQGRSGYLMHKFWEMNNILSYCKTEADFYIFYNRFGKDYLNFHKKISEKIAEGEISYIPNSLVHLFPNTIQ